MSEAASVTDAPLTVDAAIASLLTPAQPETEQETPETPAQAAEAQPEPQGETSAPEEAEAGAETAAEGQEAQEQEPAAEPLAAPAYWSKDAKEQFSQLTPELQAVVLAQEGPREEAAAKAKAEAAEVRRNADAELSKVNELAAALQDRLPQWIETFKNVWGATEPDWAAVAQEHGTEAAQRLQWQYNAQKAKLQEAAAETAKAQQLADQQFVKAEWAKLAETAPELAPDVNDPKQGIEKRQAVAEYVAKYGIPAQAIARISAAEMTIAHKAMLYDQGQAALKAAPKPKPAVQARPAAVKPGAASGQSQPNPQKQARGRFDAKPSVENAIALLLAGKG
jgi:hypothetical protein